MYSALLFSSMIGGYANTTVDVKDMEQMMKALSMHINLH